MTGAIPSLDRLVQAHRNRLWRAAALRLGGRAFQAGALLLVIAALLRLSPWPEPAGILLAAALALPPLALLAGLPGCRPTAEQSAHDADRRLIAESLLSTTWERRNATDSTARLLRRRTHRRLSDWQRRLASQPLDDGRHALRSILPAVLLAGVLLALPAHRPQAPDSGETPASGATPLAAALDRRRPVSPARPTESPARLAHDIEPGRQRNMIDAMPSDPLDPPGAGRRRPASGAPGPTEAATARADATDGATTGTGNTPGFRTAGRDRRTPTARTSAVIRVAPDTPAARASGPGGRIASTGVPASPAGPPATASPPVAIGVAAARLPATRYPIGGHDPLQRRYLADYFTPSRSR